jgi:hypothetical protein
VRDHGSKGHWAAVSRQSAIPTQSKLIIQFHWLATASGVMPLYLHGEERHCLCLRLAQKSKQKASQTEDSLADLQRHYPVVCPPGSCVPDRSGSDEMRFVRRQPDLGQVKLQLTNNSFC